MFKITIDESGDWAAEAVNLDGLMTGGNASDNFNDMIIDAIFTYFEIPPQYCDDALLLGKVANKKNKKKVFAFTPSAKFATA